MVLNLTANIQPVLYVYGAIIENSSIKPALTRHVLHRLLQNAFMHFMHGCCWWAIGLHKVQYDSLFNPHYIIHFHWPCIHSCTLRNICSIYLGKVSCVVVCQVEYSYRPTDTCTLYGVNQIQRDTRNRKTLGDSVYIDAMRGTIKYRPTIVRFWNIIVWIPVI